MSQPAPKGVDVAAIAASLDCDLVVSTPLTLLVDLDDEHALATFERCERIVQLFDEPLPSWWALLLVDELYRAAALRDVVSLLALRLMSDEAPVQ